MSEDESRDALPKYTWWVLGLTAVLLLLLTVTAIGFISAGAFDPQTIGNLQAEYHLETLSVAQQTQSIHWLEELPASDFSLRLTAAFQSGELDSGYGLVVGDNRGAMGALVSPLGYTAVVEMLPQFPMTIGASSNPLDELDSMILNGPGTAEKTTVASWPLRDTTDSGIYLIDWQTWPHIETGKRTNEIWLEMRGENVIIRINREILMTGSMPISPPRYIGLWLGSFNEGAVIDFQRLEIFANPP